MSGGTVSGVCAETSHQFYCNSTDTASQIDVWVRNHGDCNIVIEITTFELGLPEPMDGVSVWGPGDDFVQTVDVPPHMHLWFSCADLHSGESVPGPGGNCSFDWEMPVMKEPRILKEFIHDISIDPLPFLLPGEVYIKLHLPDPGPEERVRSRVRDLIRGISPQEKRAIQMRLNAIQVYVNAVEQELGKM
jgi:hypothetical protein